MKQFLFSMVVMVALAACNNEAESGANVGDSMQQDPTTGQPITTEPDTVGVLDSAHINH
jgi:hypothetical protein